MTEPNDGVEIDGDQLIATRHVAAELDLVWEVFTTPEHLAAFWGGNHATVPVDSVVVELRVGGRFELETHAANGSRNLLRFRYDLVEAPTRLVLTEQSRRITTEIRLDATETGTTVIVHQRSLPRELQSEQARLGLGGILDQLDEVVRHLTSQRSTPT